MPVTSDLSVCPHIEELALAEEIGAGGKAPYSLPRGSKLICPQAVEKSDVNPQRQGNAQALSP